LLFIHGLVSKGYPIARLGILPYIESMPVPQANPQEVFRGTLPVGTSILIVFVPSLDRDRNPIDQEYWVDQILTTLGRLFRGATAYPRGRGVWRDDQKGGLLLKEEPVIVFSYAAAEALTNAALTDLYKMLSRMGREANQGEVGVVIDGQYFGITEFISE
jgi:hypothetical protein